MKVFSWNVQGRVGATLDRQLSALVDHDHKPDIVALQEITKTSFPEWEKGLRKAGYSVVSTLDRMGDSYPEPPYPKEVFPPPRRGGIHRQIERTNFNLTAARDPIPITVFGGFSFEDSEEEKYAFPEKYLVSRVEVDGMVIHVHNAHVPHGAGRGVVKVHAYEAITRRVDADDGIPRVLCGDFNAPWEEGRDGPVIAVRRRWPEDVWDRWVKAEAALLENPRMRDVYRHDAQGEPFPVSHWTGRKEPLTGHRYDYIFVSPELEPESCTYLSDWLKRDERKWRLSDHAPVVAELRPSQKPV
jgi:exonuclease III